MVIYSDTPQQATMPLKPFMTWVGGKQREIRKFEHHIPDDYDTYIEPFIGGGALYFHLEPQKAVINDTHIDLINLYRAVQNGDGGHIYNFLKRNTKGQRDLSKNKGRDEGCLYTQHSGIHIQIPLPLKDKLPWNNQIQQRWKDWSVLWVSQVCDKCRHLPSSIYQFVEEHGDLQYRLQKHL